MWNRTAHVTRLTVRVQIELVFHYLETVPFECTEDRTD